MPIGVCVFPGANTVERARHRMEDDRANGPRVIVAKAERRHAISNRHARLRVVQSLVFQ